MAHRKFMLRSHAGESETEMVATRDPQLIREWAARRDAEPATGQATRSGPAIINIQDGGAGIRFNFPGAARFRPISWEEWFEHFDAHHLVFVHPDEPREQIASRAFQLWESRGAIEGHDLADWFEAERELGMSAMVTPPDARYRLVKDEEDDEDDTAR
jgi:hypothetical protein